MSRLLHCLRHGERPPFEVIDLHGHVGRYAHPVPDLSPEGLLKVMDRIGVRRVVCSHMQCMSADSVWGNAQVSDFMRAAPERILGYISVYPTTPDDVAQSVSSLIAAGFSGLKLHDTNGFRYDDDAYLPAFELANQRSMPVLLHVWGHPRQLEAALTIARRFPHITLILAHGGSFDVDGYIQTALAAPNIVIDVCVSRAELGMVERLVHGAGDSRIVFGSDCYFYSMTQQLGKVLGSDLTDGQKKAVLHDNPKRVLDRISR